MIDYLNLPATNYVKKSSRYAGAKVIRIGEQGFTTFSIYKRRHYPSLSEDKFVDIKEPYQYRPDLVSFDVYGTPDFWWKLMEVNGMTDIMEFKAGRNIVVPFNLLD